MLKYKNGSVLWKAIVDLDTSSYCSTSLPGLSRSLLPAFLYFLPSFSLVVLPLRQNQNFEKLKYTYFEMRNIWKPHNKSTNKVMIIVGTMIRIIITENIPLFFITKFGVKNGDFRFFSILKILTQWIHEVVLRSNQMNYPDKEACSFSYHEQANAAQEADEVLVVKSTDASAQETAVVVEVFYAIIANSIKNQKICKIG